MIIFNLQYKQELIRCYEIFIKILINCQNIKYKNMYTQQLKRQNLSKYIEMKPIKPTNQHYKTIQNKQLQIKTSFQNLKMLKSTIMKSPLKNNISLVEQYQKQLTSFTDLQRNIIDMEPSQQKQNLYKKMKNMQVDIKDYQKQIDKKIRADKNQYFQRSGKKSLMNQQLQIQQKMEGESLRTNLLNQEQQQLKYIQNKMQTIKQLTISTAELVFGVGVKINIARKNIKDGVSNLKLANQQLKITNIYQADATKMKPIFMCLVFVILIVLGLIYHAFNL